MPMSPTMAGDCGSQASVQREPRTHSRDEILMNLGTATVAMLPPLKSVTGDQRQADDCVPEFRSNLNGTEAPERVKQRCAPRWAIYWAEAAGGTVVEAVGMGALAGRVRT